MRHALPQFVTEAVEDKLKEIDSSEEKPWMKHVGKLEDLREETARINQFIEDTFEKVEPELWAPESRD